MRFVVTPSGLLKQGKPQAQPQLQPRRRSPHPSAPFSKTFTGFPLGGDADRARRATIPNLTCSAKLVRRTPKLIKPIICPMTCLARWQPCSASTHNIQNNSNPSATGDANPHSSNKSRIGDTSIGVFKAASTSCGKNALKCSLLSAASIGLFPRSPPAKSLNLATATRITCGVAVCGRNKETSSKSKISRWKLSWCTWSNIPGNDAPAQHAPRWSNPWSPVLSACSA